MLLMRWLVLFAFSFFVALVLVLTFIQPAFKQEVGMQILKYTTKPLPVYLYVLGAFLAGVGIGVVASVYGFIRSKTVEHRKNKQIRTLEQELAETKKYAVTSDPLAAPLPEAPHEPAEPETGKTP